MAKGALRKLVCTEVGSSNAQSHTPLVVAGAVPGAPPGPRPGPRRELRLVHTPQVVTVGLVADDDVEDE
jgi:hypothetical protein